MLLDSHRLGRTVISLSIDLSRRMALSNSGIVCTLIVVLVLEVRSDRVSVECLHGHLMVRCCILNLGGVARCNGFGRQRDDISHALMN